MCFGAGSRLPTLRGARFHLDASSSACSKHLCESAITTTPQSSPEMANYGYTTTYGAQGGADGGGFLAGSQAGSQDSPGGNKVLNQFV
jgi:hypothetical protein